MQTNRDSVVPQAEALHEAFNGAERHEVVLRFRWPIDQVNETTIKVIVPVTEGNPPIDIDPTFERSMDLTKREMLELREHLINEVIRKLAVL